MKILRGYQETMIDLLVSTPRCALWAGMGLGKTAAVLHALDRLHLSGVDVYPALVIAPLRVARDVWPEEARDWPETAGIRVSAIVGSKHHRRDAMRTPADLYTVNFENLVDLIHTWGTAWPYKTVIVDEATKLKSLRATIRRNAQGTEWVQGQGGSRAKALLQVLRGSVTSRIIELSGTPTPNGLSDLWGQVFFLDYGRRLGRSFDAYQTRWFRPSFDGYGYEPLPHAQEQIQAALADVCLSMRSEDYFDLEAVIVHEIKVALPPAAKAQYREMERALYTEIQETPVEAFNAGAKTQKLLQMAAGFAYTGHASDPGPRKWVNVHEAKLDALEEIVEEAAGAPLLVGYHFEADLARILARFKQAVHFSQAKGIQERWNAGKIPMLLAHAGSMGHGLSLQHGGCRLVRYSTDWNHEQFAQILERIGPTRQAQSGYTRNVYEYRIITEGTSEEDVYDCHATKGSVQDSLMKGMRRRQGA